MQKDEHRLVPRFPLPKEKVKFFFKESQPIFAVRDISSSGLGISLLEFGDVAFFPEGSACEAELKLDGEPLKVHLKVARTSAWSVGFTFEEMAAPVREKILQFIDPLQIGASLKSVDKKGAPEAFLLGMSAWYHGNSATDLFFWGDSRGGVHKALLCVGSHFWQWQEAGGVSTGEVSRQEGDRVALHRDATLDLRMVNLTRKVLEHADAVDSRLRSFLRERLN